MAAKYSFVSRWHLPVGAPRAWDEIERMLRPGADRSWWPRLAVEMPPRRLVPGERLVLTVRSPLGYRLRVLLEITRVEPGRELAATSEGDLQGSGRIVVTAAGVEASVVDIHWDVSTRRAWMNATAWLLRPAFARAHAHVMRRGELGLRRLLAAGRSEVRNADNRRIRAARAVRAG